MYLIVNADDYGYSDLRDDGILECFRQGMVTNVSLMVNGYSARRGAEKAKQAGLPMGLHVNISEGAPAAKKKFETLVNNDGMFLGMVEFREAAEAGTINLQEVETEIQAQIDKFVQLTGNKPGNVDGHQHIHVLPGICKVFAEVMHRNNIYMTRLPIEQGIDNYKYNTEEMTNAIKGMVQQGRKAVNIFSQHGLRSAGFTGLRTMGQEMCADMNADKLKACILEAFAEQDTKPQSEQAGTLTFKAKGDVSASSVVELMTHPGNMTGSDGGCGDGPDWFSQSPDRENEMAVLMSNEMKAFYRDNNIKLVAFKDCQL